ncbi:MAG: helix-turn-helix transcriptional regulator [Patescibacteria group bacterium]
MEPGKRLRRLRQRKGMTQADLAALLGVTEFTVCRYENGRIAMPIEAIRKAAEVFDACPAFFLDDAGCELGRDAELVDLMRRADRLDDQGRELVKKTLRALLDSLPPPGRRDAGGGGEKEP